MKEEKKNSGWSAVPHKLLEKLAKSKLPARKIRIILIVWRRTEGCTEYIIRIAYSEYKKLCGIGKRNAFYLVKELIEEQYLYDNGKYLVVNLNYDQWGIVTKYGNDRALPFPDKSVTENGTKSVTENGNLKRTLKDTIKKKGLSASLRKKKHEEFKKGFAMMKKIMGKVPDKKK